MTTVVVLVGVALALVWPREPTYNGHTLSHWVGRMAAGSFKERADASPALDQVGPEAVPALKRLLAMREHNLGHTLLGHLSTLIPRFFSPPPGAVAIHVEAFSLVGRLGPAATSAVPALLECLDAADAIERQLLSNTLHSLDEAAGSVLLKEGLRHPSLVVRTWVVAAVFRSVPPGDAERALPVLLELSQSEDAEARRAAAKALTMLALRHQSAAAEAAVMRLALDPDPLVAVGIATACLPASAQELTADGPARIESLWQPMEPGSSPPQHPAGLVFLEALLEHPSAEIRAMVASEHWQLARNTAAVLPVFIEALEEPTVIWLAGAGLRNMGPAAEPAIPALLDAVVREPVHRPDRTPASTAMALAAIGPPALPGLLTLLDHENLDVRFSAANAIRVLGPAAPEAVPGLLRLLAEPSAEAKTLACDTLGAIGPAAVAALPELEKLEATSRGYPQAAAAEAMRRIRQKSPPQLPPEGAS